MEPTPAPPTGQYPVQVDLTCGYEVARWRPLVNWLLAIPHYIVVYVLFVAVFVVKIIAFSAVIFTGRYPEGMRDFVVGVFRWQLRVQSYVGLMPDAYPPFSLSQR